MKNKVIALLATTAAMIGTASASVADAQAEVTTVTTGLAASAVTVSALGLAVWIGPYAVARVRRAFSKNAG